MSAGGNSAQTHGWDMVFAMHISDVNAAIAAAGSSPGRFSQRNAEGYGIEGQFGDWTLVPGGAGDLLRLAIPLRKTKITNPGAGRPGLPVDGALNVELRLDLVQDRKVAGRQHLVVRTSAPAPGALAVTVVDVQLSDSKAGFQEKIVIKTLMQDWLNANLGDFAHVFASVDLGRKAANGAFQWMQPTGITYAYTDLGSETDGALAILAMTGGRSAKGLTQQVSSACLPQGQRASLLISKERVMAELVLPALPFAFKGAKRTDFRLVGTSIVNKGDDSIAFTTFHDGKTYTATLHALEARIDGTELKLDVTTDVWLAPGIYSRTKTVSRMLLDLGKTKGGEQTLVFQDASGSPVTSHEVVTSLAIKILKVFFGLAAALALAIATLLSGGVALVVVGIVVAFALGADMIGEKWHEGDAPSIGAAVLEATAAISWPMGNSFRLKSAQLHDSLQLAGAFEVD